MDKIIELSDVVEVIDPDGKPFRCMVSAIETPGAPWSRVKISPTNTSLSARGSLLVGRWIPHGHHGEPSSWRWPA